MSDFNRDEVQLVDYSRLSEMTEVRYLDNNHRQPFTGKALRWHDNGMLSGCMSYKDGLADGVLQRWSNDGRPLAVWTCKEGRFLTSKRWDLSFYLKESSYKDEAGMDEILHGVQRVWHSIDQLYKETNYVNGKLDGLRRQWHRNGQLQVQLLYKRDTIEGKVSYWYASGQKSEESHVISGQWDGLLQRWHENGQLAEEKTYSNGIEQGVSRHWNEQGEEIMDNDGINIFRNK